MKTDKRRIALALVAVALGGAVAMRWFGKSKRDGAWDLAHVERPWRDGSSIYAHITEHVVPGTKGLAEGGDRLPDEKDDGRLKWVAGGLDGAFGHHVGGGAETSRAKMLHRSLKVVLDDASPEKLENLYQQLLQESALDYIDPLLEIIVEKQDLNVERLEELAVWLAKNAPDREPVKFAIALLGVIPDSEHTDLLLTLGRHEEFTLYVAVALSNTLGDRAEDELFHLAQHVDGWGRIQLVERLAETENPEIKRWMLREGYRNSVMYEYLAYTCAVAGDLRRELEADAVDGDLLEGAGEIIQALVIGGPAEDMDDYVDGAVVVERYLHHLGDEPRDLGQLITVDSVHRFLDQENADWAARESRGWTPEVRSRLEARAKAIKALPHWEQVVNEGLASDDPRIFAQADQAAKALGMDTWEHHYRRLESGLADGWYYVMQTDDPDRIERVLSLAERVLPLDAIASGPAEELGFGPEWANHRHLDFVLQDLRRFPGKGWPLIKAGIRSPVIRNRHMALRALSTWGRESWPPDAKALLEQSLRDEPDADVRDDIEILLAGH